MIDAVQERMKGHTIFLYLPKPIDLEGVCYFLPWDFCLSCQKPPEMSSRRDNTYYEEDEDSSIQTERNASMSHKAQIVRVTTDLIIC
jgi:hypothetical protein